MNTRLHKLPAPVVRRLPHYLIDVEQLQARGVTWISSSELGCSLGLTSSTVRQDLSHLDFHGVAKRGYEISKLLAALIAELGADRRHRVVIAGAGLLGSAIALHGDLDHYGFEVRALLDVDPEILGTRVGAFQVLPMSALSQVVERDHIDIGIIAVPARAAQGVADVMIAEGITALLNLAQAQLRTPETVQVVEERIVSRLQELAYLLRSRGAAQDSPDRSEPYAEEPV